MENSKKVAFITGANKGIGLGFAKHLLKNKYIVIIASRNRTEELNILLKNKNCKFIKGDVTKIKNVKQIYVYINKNFKKIDLLINNVGDYIYKDIMEFEPIDFKYIIDSNLISTFNCSKILLPLIKEKGQIINIGYSSCEKITYSRHRSPYNIAKTGIFILTKVFANSLNCRNIRVNMISPGVVENSIRKPSDLPFNRPCSYKDLINALDFLLKEESDYISGDNIEVSGGLIPNESL